MIAMKIRNFYPANVYRRLSGQRVSCLNGAQSHALKMVLRRSRKMGLAVTIMEDHIDVRSAAELGKMVLADLKKAAQDLHPHLQIDRLVA
jgi:geranylgeranyl pyrophosphate synthase